MNNRGVKRLKPKSKKGTTKLNIKFPHFELPDALHSLNLPMIMWTFRDIEEFNLSDDSVSRKGS